MFNFFTILCASFFLISCSEDKNDAQLVFVTSGDYPPFEYVERGELVGFDIDLAKLIAKELGKEAVFEQMPFQSLVNAVKSKKADAAIATLTITPERAQEIDFSVPYYFEKLAVVYRKAEPVQSSAELEKKHISVQMGSTMELWLKNNIKTAQLSCVNTNNQAIESLKSGQVDAALLDGVQAIEFVKNNSSLGFSYVGESTDGYAIALEKNSPLTEKINTIIEQLKQSGELDKLKKKWVTLKE